MDLIKQYIIQSISAASNNLRLTPQKIEVVALLREAILKSENLERDIKEMKKVTELSKFAIRLHEIYTFLTQPFVDFFRISEKFKEHSQYLIKDLSYMLDIVNPVTFKAALNKVNPSVPEKNQETGTPGDKVIDVDLSRRSQGSSVFEKGVAEVLNEEDVTKEKKDDEEGFQNFESQILYPIKPLDSFLQNLDPGNVDKEALAKFREQIHKNAEFSSRVGFEIIAGMHNIIFRSLDLIGSDKLVPDKKTIESIRACLIVIVAVIKGKELDVSGYLNRAEEFANELQNIK
jgi:hypothetical protein